MVDRKVVQRVGPMARKMFGLAGWIARSETRQSFRKNSDQGSERELRHREMRHARIAKDLLVNRALLMSALTLAPGGAIAITQET